ncbi:MAG: MBL fold metallo-hydrolase [Anaerolineae bacterium]
MLEHIHWLGHASFLIDGPGGQVIYIDPWRLPEGSPAASLILISHDHYDHFSVEDIRRVSTPATVLLSNQRVAEALGQAEVLLPWQSVQPIADVAVRAVPAYTPDSVYHARECGGLGVVITMLRHEIYYAGDTGLIEEMSLIGCDIALLPVGGQYTMNYEEAAHALELLQPQTAVPMHYGSQVSDSRSSGKLFCQLAAAHGVEAVELPIENPAFVES